jgi:hypothetical protein
LKSLFGVMNVPAIKDLCLLASYSTLYCVLLCLQNALASTNHLKLQTVTQEHVAHICSYALHVLLANAEKAPSRRLSFDCLKPRKTKGNWIACEVCGRWNHKTCVQRAEDVKGGYVCVVCNAQYK